MKNIPVKYCKDNRIARILVWGGATLPMPPGRFSVISRSRPGSLGGGGVVADFFSVAAGKDQSNSLNYGRFLDISGRPGDHPPFLETHGNSGRLGRSA